MIRTAPQFRALGLWLVASALALRLVIAPGFMPVAGNSGLTISMCTSTGAVDRRVPGVPEAPVPATKGCAFAALALAAPPPVPVAVAVPVALSPDAAPLPPMAARPHLGAIAPPPPAIGPPLLI